MATGKAGPKIGLDTQQDTLIGTVATAQTATRGAKVLGFIGFGLNIAGTAALTASDPANSFPNSLPVLVPAKGGAGFATATPVESGGTLSWTLA
jgi:hypothetical protein